MALLNHCWPRRRLQGLDGLPLACNTKLKISLHARLQHPPCCQKLTRAPTTAHRPPPTAHSTKRAPIKPPNKHPSDKHPPPQQHPPEVEAHRRHTQRQLSCGRRLHTSAAITAVSDTASNTVSNTVAVVGTAGVDIAEWHRCERGEGASGLRGEVQGVQGGQAAIGWEGRRQKERGSQGVVGVRQAGSQTHAQQLETGLSLSLPFCNANSSSQP